MNKKTKKNSFTSDGFYGLFRGSGFIDGGYCGEFEQLCPFGPGSAASKCLKVTSSFLGPNLRGTPLPDAGNCPAFTPRNIWPNNGKGYYTPSNEALWTLPRGSCLDAAAAASVGVSSTPFVPALTGRADIHPTFYAPLPPIFANGCQWLTSSTAPTFPGLAGFGDIYQHGYDSGLGWAAQNGYCA